MKGKALILIGYMGCGKTTVSKLLAERSGKELLDSDLCIEKEAEMSINEIFASEGEATFRQMETELLEKLVKEGFDGILSCGGGMPLREENRELLKQLGTVVYLKAAPEVIASRLKDDQSRPLLKGLNDEEKVKKIREMFSLREAAYAAGADLEIDTGEMSQEEVASCIFNSIHI